MNSNSPKKQAFIDDLLTVYRKHGMSLAHDGYDDTAFRIEAYDLDNVEALSTATLGHGTVHEADAWIAAHWMGKDVVSHGVPHVSGVVIKTTWDEKGALHCFIEGETGSAWCPAARLVHDLHTAAIKALTKMSFEEVDRVCTEMGVIPCHRNDVDDLIEALADSSWDGQHGASEEFDAKLAKLCKIEPS